MKCGEMRLLIRMCPIYYFLLGASLEHESRHFLQTFPPSFGSARFATMSHLSSAGAVVVVVIILLLVGCCYSKHRRAYQESAARSSSQSYRHNPPRRPDQVHTREERIRSCNFTFGLNYANIIDQSHGLWFDRMVNGINDRLEDVEQGIINTTLKAAASRP